jgi:hypothetical protein
VVPPSPTTASVWKHQRFYSSPLDVGEAGGHRGKERHRRCCGLGLREVVAGHSRSKKKKVALGGVAALGKRLMGPAPQRPSQPELSLFFGTRHSQDEAPNLRNGRRDQLEVTTTIPLLASDS